MRRGGRQDDQSEADRRNRGHRGDHEKPLSFLGRVSVHVPLYVEQERGGVGPNTEEPQYFRKTKGFHLWGPRSLGGAPSSTRMPPHHPNFQVLPAAQVKRRETSGAGASGRADIQGKPARHWLESSWEAFRRAASEGSLYMTVEFSLND